MLNTADKLHGSVVKPKQCYGQISADRPGKRQFRNQYRADGCNVIKHSSTVSLHPVLNYTLTLTSLLTDSQSCRSSRLMKSVEYKADSEAKKTSAACCRQRLLDSAAAAFHLPSKLELNRKAVTRN